VRTLRFCLAFLIAAVAPGAITESDAPSIIKRSVVAINTDWDEAPKYAFLERDTGSKTGGEPKTYQVTMIDGSPYRRLIAIDDRPVSLAVQANEERKLTAEIGKRRRESLQERARRIEKYKNERAQDQVMMQEMAEAFSFHPAGEETVDGHRCWVFEAEPKRGYQPVRRESKVLVGMRGRLWIDEHQYQWVKVEAEVFKTVSFYGFLAKVGPGTRFELEQEPVANGLWLPKHFLMRVSASALGFIDESRSEDETYRDYRPVAAVSAQVHNR